jgi:hypothetical protein
MATRRYARAIVCNPSVQFDEWMETLRKQHEGAIPKDQLARTASVVLRKCNPNQYLLSHATIVASVDCYAPRSAKTGRQMVYGAQIDVRWPDYRIRPECHELINNNGDAWERSLLLQTYRTFIGAANYLEHIQLPALSKGFIVDAIARDLGKTCYVDILVATERKHQQLVTDILSGVIIGLSMGCISLFTICTKCGNVASDDSQSCPCIMYEGKGRKFSDEDGIEHPISELIGHSSVPNSNQFIEASWVRNPAFSGAIRRGFLNLGQETIEQIGQAKTAYEMRQAEPQLEGLRHAASVRRGQALDDTESQFQTEMDAAQGGQTQAPVDGTDQTGTDQGQVSPTDDPISNLVQKAQEQLLELLVKGLGEKLTPKPEDVGSVAPVSLPVTMHSNDNLVRAFDQGLARVFTGQNELVKWASKVWRIAHLGGRHAIKNAHLSPRDMVVLSWIEDRINGWELPAEIYQIAMNIGPITAFPSETSFLAACRTRMGRNPTPGECTALIRKGRVASIANF